MILELDSAGVMIEEHTSAATAGDRAAAKSRDSGTASQYQAEPWFGLFIMIIGSESPDAKLFASTR
jgi:hypothetical protein